MSTPEARMISGTLWGLWDLMIEYDIRLLIFWLRSIEEFEHLLLTGAPMGGPGPIDGPPAIRMPLTPSSSPDERLNQNGRKWLSAIIDPLDTHIQPLSLTAAKLEIQYIRNKAHLWTAREMASQLEDFRKKLEDEINDRFFLYLNSDEAQLFREKEPFGPDVSHFF